MYIFKMIRWIKIFKRKDCESYVPTCEENIDDKRSVAIRYLRSKDRDKDGIGNCITITRSK